MSRLFAATVNDGTLLTHALYSRRDLLQVPAVESPYGWGLGYYHHQDVLIKRRPNHQGPLDFYHAIEHLKARMVIGHVRKRTVGHVSPENTHPFRFRNWLFAHHGTIDRFDAVKNWVLNSIPGFLRRSMRGDTDSEHLFYLYMAFLFDDGLIDATDLTALQAAQSLRNTLHMVARFVREAGGEPNGLNLVVTNGKILVMAVCDRPTFWTKIDGIEDCALCRRDPGWNLEATVRSHPHLRGVMAFSDPPPEAALTGLARIPMDTALAVEEDLSTDLVPLHVVSSQEV